MSTSFSANQYENAFISKKLGNWECPNTYPERPMQMSGSTRIIANDRGHLKDGVQRSHKNPWGNFVGTWDLPKKIPGNCANVNTARTTYAQQRLKMASAEANGVLRGEQKNASRRVRLEDPRPRGMDNYMTDNAQPTDNPNTYYSFDACKPATPIAEYNYVPRSVTPQKAPSPKPDPYVFATVQSPIPTVPDIPEVLAQEAVRARQQTPQTQRINEGLYAF